MKNFWIAIGKALLYLVLFFGVQMLVTIPLIISDAFEAGLQAAFSGEMINLDETISNVTASLGDKIYMVTLISSILTLVVLIVMFLVRKKNPIKEVQISAFKAGFILPVILVAVSTQLLLAAIMSFVPFPQTAIDSYINNISLVTNKISVLSLISVGVLAPITEEVIFRGLIFSRLRRGMPVYVAVIIQAVLFASLHVGIVWMLQVFVMGVIFALMTLKLGSIIPSIIAHMAVNVAGVLLNTLMPDELSDMTGYLILAVCAVVFVVSMFIMMKKGQPKVIEEPALEEQTVIEEI